MTEEKIQKTRTTLNNKILMRIPKIVITISNQDKGIKSKYFKILKVTIRFINKTSPKIDCLSLFI